MNVFWGMGILGGVIILLGVFARPLVKLEFEIARDLEGRDPQRLITDMDQHVAFRRFLFIAVGAILIFTGLILNRMNTRLRERQQRDHENMKRWERELEENRRPPGLPKGW